MNKPLDSTNIGEYINELSDQKGIAVMTVDDGHVFVITKETLQSLLAQAEAKQTNKVVLFVKSSALIPTN